MKADIDKLWRFSGIELRAGSPGVFTDYARKIGETEVGYPDWRARLNRNLSRRSTGRWEPLTWMRPDYAPDEHVYLIQHGGRTIAIGHPMTIARAREAIEHETTGANP